MKLSTSEFLLFSFLRSHSFKAWSKAEQFYLKPLFAINKQQNDCTHPLNACVHPQYLHHQCHSLSFFSLQICADLPHQPCHNVK